MSKEGDSKDAVNFVAAPISDKSVLLEAECAIHGPNSIQLPVLRDANKLAFTLDQVLSSVECDRLVQAAEAVGFGVAGLGRAGEQTAAAELRDSARLIVDDPLLAQQIYQRIRPYLPTVWQGRRILGLNEQLKFLRYHPGQKFVAHYDGAFCRPDTPNKTCLTVQLYLSTDKIVGGSTRFVGAFGENGVSCSPSPGMALVFQHNILHEGEEVKDGVKYTIRTDVEYGGETLSGQLQELLGLGGSPIQQKKRSLLLVPMLIVLISLVCRA